MQVAACSHEIYEEILGIGPDDHHDSCTNNLHNSLAVRLPSEKEREKERKRHALIRRRGASQGFHLSIGICSNPSSYVALPDTAGSLMAGS